MDAKVKEFLEQKQAEEKEAKNNLLKKLGIFYKVAVSEKDGYDDLYIDEETKDVVFCKCVYPEITDEEFQMLRKYDLDCENNGEKGLFITSVVFLVLCVVGGTVCLFTARNIPNVILGVEAILIGFVQFWMVKVFTNISRKSTAIYNLLKKREE